MSSLIETSKQEYFSRIAKKLSDPSVSSKTYWFILKSLLMDKKVSCIPPVFHENKIITDCREKAGLFNSFFANQCSLIKNTSVNFENLTDKSFSNITFTDKHIGKIVKGLDLKEAHSHSYAKASRKVYLQAFTTCVQSLFRSRDFPLCLGKANVVPIHKENDKQSIKN